MPIILEGGGGSSWWTTTASNYAIEIQVDSWDANIKYVGKAALWSVTADAVRQIQRLDKNTGLVVKWAEWNANFDNIFDDRETLTYN